MARLLDWPVDLRWNRWKPLNGPQSIGAGASTTIGDVTQGVASPFGARHMQFSFPPMRGVRARRARGLITALHMGANAVRVEMRDFDGMSRAEAGVIASQAEIDQGKPFSSGAGWSNGQNWQISKPLVPVDSGSSFDTTIVRLTNAFWGPRLGMGDWIGFSPFHFGMYEVTEVIRPGAYRVWPPLRKAITADDVATLRPVLAMRMLSNNLPDAERGPALLEGLTISLFEVFDYDARDYFTD